MWEADLGGGGPKTPGAAKVSVGGKETIDELFDAEEKENESGGVVAFAEARFVIRERCIFNGCGRPLHSSSSSSSEEFVQAEGDELLSPLRRGIANGSE